MIGAAEALFGPYDWERFDILTMPPSFPYGGMENPRLTFLTPTLIAGDRSLVSRRRARARALVDRQPRHERERRALLAQRRLHRVRRAPHRRGARGRRAWPRCTPRSVGASSTSRSSGSRTSPRLTQLRTHLDGVDPDEAFSLIPYEKGYLFLCAIEARGRPRARSRAGCAATSRRSASARSRPTTSQRTSRRRCPARSPQANAHAWLDGAGVPANAPPLRSAKLDAIEALGATLPTREQTAAWSPTEWALYLESVPRPAPEATCRALDAQYQLTREHELRRARAVADARAQVGLPRGACRASSRCSATVGRMKYLRPLYTALAADAATRDRREPRSSRSTRASYHPIARQMVETIVR